MITMYPNKKTGIKFFKWKFKLSFSLNQKQSFNHQKLNIYEMENWLIYLSAYINC